MHVCKKCRAGIRQQGEKALNGEWATVWTDVNTGEWVCMYDGDEHEPMSSDDQSRFDAVAETLAAAFLQQNR